MQLTDKTKRDGVEWETVNDIFNWSIDGINLINARLAAIEQRLAALAAPAATGGASAKEIADELAARLRV